MDAALQPFYSQTLSGASCGERHAVHHRDAPLDWATPSQARSSSRSCGSPRPATAIGSLLVNPGGPGGSGYDFVHDSVDYATSERLQQSFDIVGFDPRGVGRSSAVVVLRRPGSTSTSTSTTSSPGEFGSDEWLANASALERRSSAPRASSTPARCCSTSTPISAARDLDLLRAVLGDTKLNFLGYSYGTFLGATYADLYPEKTGRLVLDGALDPAPPTST